MHPRVGDHATAGSGTSPPKRALKGQCSLRRPFRAYIFLMSTRGFRPLRGRLCSEQAISPQWL